MSTPNAFVDIYRYIAARRGPFTPKELAGTLSYNPSTTARNLKKIAELHPGKFVRVQGGVYAWLDGVAPEAPVRAVRDNPGRPLSPQEKKRGSEMFAGGLTEREVAAALGCGVATAHRLKESIATAPAEPAQEPLIPAPVAAPAEPSPTFEEFLPDDTDLYPPFKVQIYDHWRGRRGEQWFRVRDEHGKRGVFRYIDED